VTTNLFSNTAYNWLSNTRNLLVNEYNLIVALDLLNDMNYISYRFQLYVLKKFFTGPSAAFPLV